MDASDLKECEKIERSLSERLEAHDKSRKDAQERLEDICKGLEASVDELESRTSSELEEKSTAESNRLQNALADLQADDGGISPNADQRAKAVLLAMQSYDVIEHNDEVKRKPNFDASSLYELKTEKAFVPDAVETLKPTGVSATKVGKWKISLKFTCLSPDIMKALSELRIENQIKYKCLLAKKGERYGRFSTIFIFVTLLLYKPTIKA